MKLTLTNSWIHVSNILSCPVASIRTKRNQFGTKFTKVHMFVTHCMNQHYVAWSVRDILCHWQYNYAEVVTLTSPAHAQITYAQPFIITRHFYIAFIFSILDLVGPFSDLNFIPRLWPPFFLVRSVTLWLIWCFVNLALPLWILKEACKQN